MMDGAQATVLPPLSSEDTIICVGAQKSATTRLHMMLMNSGRFISPTKEVEFWSSLANIRGDIEFRKIPRKRSAYVYAVFRDLFGGQFRSCFRRVRRLEFDQTKHLAVQRNDPDILFKRYTFNADNKRSFLDISPDYMLLPPQYFTEIDDYFYNRVRFILMMRDPVTRLWSMVKHYSRSEKGNVDNSIINQVFRRVVKNDNDIGYARSRYDQTALKLEDRVPRERIGYFFHEHLFSHQQFEELANFVGLPNLDHGDPDLRVNVSEAKIEPDPAVWREAYDKLLPAYEWAFKNFGDRVPLQWVKSSAIGRPEDGAQR